MKSGGGSASIIVFHAMSTSCCTTTASCSQLISSHPEMPDMVNGLSKQDALWLNFQFFKALNISPTWNDLVLQALCHIVLCEQVVDGYWYLQATTLFNILMHFATLHSHVSSVYCV